MKKSLYSFIFLILLSTVSIFAQSETEKGVELYRNSDFDGAISVLEDVVKTDAKERKAWTYLGASLLKKKKEKEAKEAFETAKSISVTLDEVNKINEGLKIIAKPRCNYTDSARNNNVQGRVSFAVEFKANREIGFVFPVKTLPNGLTESCIEAVRRIKFEPAQKDEKTLSVIVFLEYSFTLY